LKTNSSLYKIKKITVSFKKSIAVFFALFGSGRNKNAETDAEIIGENSETISRLKNWHVIFNDVIKNRLPYKSLS
jgi:hypothetical protein